MRSIKKELEFIIDKTYENLNKENNYKNFKIEFSKKESTKNEKYKEYSDCSFTKTCRVVDKMNGYVAEVLEISYVIVYKFQSHNAYAHPILTNLEED